MYAVKGSSHVAVQIKRVYALLCAVLLATVYYLAWRLDHASVAAVQDAAPHAARTGPGYRFQAGALTIIILVVGAAFYRHRVVRRRHHDSRREIDDLESRALFTHAIIEHLHLGIVVTDRDDVIRSVNPAGARIFSAPGPLVGTRFTSLIGAAAPDHTGDRRIPSDGGRAGIDVRELGIHRIDRHGGDSTWIDVSRSEFDGGKGRRFLYTFRDVTGDEKIRESQQISNEVLRHIAEGVVITNADAVIQFINPAFSTITGYQPEEAIGNTPRLLQSGLHDAAFYSVMWRDLLTRGRWSGEIWNRRKSGEVYPEQLGINAIRDSTGRTSGYVAIFYDITQRKREEEHLHRLARYDSLTGLANRRELLQHLETITRVHVPGDPGVAVLFVDLDGFKSINDRLGHDVGDRVLRETAQRIRRCTRRQDSAARIGGDEFVVVLVGVDDEGDPARFAHRLIELVSRPYGERGEITGVTASIGIAVYPRDGDSAASLLRAADAAMYRAKQSGKNRFHPCHDDEVAARA